MLPCDSLQMRKFQKQNIVLELELAWLNTASSSQVWHLCNVPAALARWATLAKFCVPLHVVAARVCLSSAAWYGGWHENKCVRNLLEFASPLKHSAAMGSGMCHLPWIMVSFVLPLCDGVQAAPRAQQYSACPDAYPCHSTMPAQQLISASKSKTPAPSKGSSGSATATRAALGNLTNVAPSGMENMAPNMDTNTKHKTQALRAQGKSYY